MNAKWSHKGSNSIKSDNFEMSIEIGSYDPDSTGRLMKAIHDTVMREGRILFPPAEQPQHKPCKGCPDSGNATVVD